MTPSDFLTILGIAIAVWAFIPNKERKFVLLFFSNWELILCLITIFYIHFLLSFDWLQSNWWSWLNIFTVEKGIPATTWAYIVSLLLISFPILKINFGYFSRSKLNNLIALHNTLIDEDEIDLLANYILKYHIFDVQKYLEEYSKLPDKDTIDIILRRKTEADLEYDKLVKPKRAQFAESVYWSIIDSELFVRKTANKYPELFATVFKGMQSTRASNPDLIKLYLECLFEAKNQKLAQELKILNEGYGSIKSRAEEIDLPIMESLMHNTEVAAENYVWYPIAKGAIKSLHYDDSSRVFLIMKYDDQLEPELWNHKIYLAIVYFNYMVRESIFRESHWHMWLFFYRDFVKGLIENIPVPDTQYETFCHYLIREIISIMRYWLKLAVEQNTTRRTIDINRCLGNILCDIAEAPQDKLSDGFKSEIFERIIDVYFDLSNHQNHEVADSIRTHLEGVFKNPNHPESHEVNVTQGFLSSFQEGWNHFDRVPFQGFEDNGSIQRFAENVLIPLGISTEGLLYE